MIRSSKVSIKLSNKNKLDNLIVLIDEYKRVAEQFLDILWKEENLTKFISKEFSDCVDTWLSKRILQCVGKQVIGIIKGTRKKQNSYLFIMNKLIKENKIKEYEKLKLIYEKLKVSKPNIKNIEPQLDNRFFKIDLNNKTSFDGWISLTSIGNKLKLILPFKRNSHFNKLYKNGNLNNSIRISKNFIHFSFDLKPKLKIKGKTLGVDIGLSNVFSTSENQCSVKNKDNYDLHKIITIMNRKIKGSRGFKKSQEHRKNYINWCVNQLNLKDIKEVKIENIKYLRYKRKTSKLLRHWSYAEIFDKLENYCEEQGVLVLKINPTYTSQRCSVCGWTQKSNRNGKLFKCKKCNHITDADLNAAINISFNLQKISFEERLKSLNKNGFYWELLKSEPIVPVVLKTE